MEIERIRTACRRILNNQSYAPSSWSILQLVQDGLRANEVSRGTTIFSDDPGQTSLYGCRGLIEVVPVQTHSRFPEQRVTCTQTSELDGRAEESGCKEGSMRGSDRNLVGWVNKQQGFGTSDRGLTDLEAVLTSVSAACDVHVDALERNECAPAECQRAQIVGCQSLQVVRCRGTCLESATLKLSGADDAPCRASSPHPSSTSCSTGPSFERSLVFHSANRASNHAKSSVPLAAFVTT